MKTLSLTAFNRPSYLQKALQSLSRNDLAGYDRLYIGLEPGNAQVLEICKNINFIDTEIIQNKSVLGVRDNPYSLLKTVFDRGSKLNVYLEDDVLISPDALSLANWYDHLPARDEYLCLSLFRKLEPLGVALVEESSKFDALGFVLSREQWCKYFEKYWYAQSNGWDHSIRGMIKELGVKTLIPGQSRSFHIGREGGVHYRPQLHDRVHLKIDWNKSERISEFSLEKSQ